jgi:hypothetical protein
VSRTRRTAASRITRETGTRRRVFYALNTRRARAGGGTLERVFRRWWPADHDDWDQIRLISWGPGPLYPSTHSRWRRS